jgi:hypothetical protein
MSRTSHRLASPAYMLRGYYLAPRGVVSLLTSTSPDWGPTRWCRFLPSNSGGWRCQPIVSSVTYFITIKLSCITCLRVGSSTLRHSSCCARRSWGSSLTSACGDTSSTLAWVEVIVGGRRGHPVDLEQLVKVVLPPTASKLQQGMALGVIPGAEL